jgi:hypothetical protein
MNTQRRMTVAELLVAVCIGGLSVLAALTLFPW